MLRIIRITLLLMLIFYGCYVNAGARVAIALTLINFAYMLMAESYGYERMTWIDSEGTLYTNNPESLPYQYRIRAQYMGDFWIVTAHSMKEAIEEAKERSENSD